jgi:colanic acid biosynthesis glycosyl transferase WcaI
MVSSISGAMVDRLMRLGVPKHKTFFFPNWVDCKAMCTISGGVDFRHEWNIANDCKVVLYAGNMGRKQGLDIVIDTAKTFSSQRPDVLFVMVGDGAARPELVAEARSHNLQNIVFKPLQSLENLPSLLSMADVHLVIQKRGAADAVLPSKLNGIWAVGGFALITADQHTELGKLVSNNPGIALLVEPENKDAFVHALNAALDDMHLRVRGGCIAKEYAEHYLDTDNILSSAESKLCELVQA